MIDWLGMERPGGGRDMENWRWVYGGAAKGQNMNGDASDVHASSGYLALAAYVNDKAQIKTDKVKAWTADTAEKRWTSMKTLYRKAVFLPVPIAEHNEDFEDEMKQLAENRDTICKDFARLYKLLCDHPSTQPQHTIDSMRPVTAAAAAALTLDNGDASDEDEGDDHDHDHDDDANDGDKDKASANTTAAAADGVASASSGDKRSRNSEEAPKGRKEKEQKTTPTLTKQQEAAAKKSSFHLKKATSESSSKRQDIQTLFLKSQEENAKNAKAQMKTSAILQLITSGITAPEQIKTYMALMFGENAEGEQRGPVCTKMTVDNVVVVDLGAK
jgi:hypothetical protein